MHSDEQVWWQTSPWASYSSFEKSKTGLTSTTVFGGIGCDAGDGCVGLRFGGRGRRQTVDAATVVVGVLDDDHEFT